MRALVFAIGNPLRADDGVARLAAEGLGRREEVNVIEQMQLTPETTETMARADVVVFIDADAQVDRTTLERIDDPHAEVSCFSHILNPIAVTTLARRLYAFTGQAWICHVPAHDFTLGAPVTARARAGAREAAALVEELLEVQCTKHH